MFVVFFSDITSAVAMKIYYKAKALNVPYFSEYTATYNQNAVVGLVTKGDADTLAKLCTDKTKVRIFKEVN